MVTLLEVIEGLDVLPEEATIYAQQPWSDGSTAIAGIEDDDGRPPESARLGHLDYFLEVSIAREILEDWADTLDHSATPSERCARIIRYAEDDA
jgi:hypothetical protein